jgi:hypothetical protein
MKRRRDSWSIELAVRAAIPVALELPRREAAEVKMEPLNSRRSYRAGVIDPWPGPRAVRASGWQLSSADYFSGFCTQDFLVGHGESPGSGGVVMPDARRP